jgi:hypothetical protein
MAGTLPIPLPRISTDVSEDQTGATVATPRENDCSARRKTLIWRRPYCAKVNGGDCKHADKDDCHIYHKYVAQDYLARISVAV